MSEVLYDKTGDIRDVNTVLVPLDKLRELQAEARRYRWLRDVGDATWRPFGLRDGCSAKQADANIDATIDSATHREGGKKL